MSLLPRIINQFDEVWESECKPQILKLFTPGEQIAFGAPLYNTIYHLAVATPVPFVPELYREFGLVFVHIASELLAGLKSCGNELVRSYVDIWHRYKIGAERLDSLGSYLNRLIAKVGPTETAGSSTILLPDGREVEVEPCTILQSAWHVWKAVVLEPFWSENNRLVVAILEIYTNTLRHDCNNSKEGLVKDAISSFYQCSSGLDPIRSSQSMAINFQETFETAFLDHTRELYTNGSSERIQKSPVEAYLRWADGQLVLEDRLANAVLPSSAIQARLMRVCETEIISRHLPLLQSNILGLFQKGLLPDLTLIYSLMRRVSEGGIESLASTFKEFLIRKGTAQFEEGQSANIEQFIHGFQGLYEEALNYREKIFKKDAIFDEPSAAALRQLVLDVGGARIAERLASYMDSILLTSGYPEKQMTASINLLRHIPDREVFQRTFLRASAHRLLALASSMTAANSDPIAEQSRIVQDLSLICDRDFVSKLTKMYADINASGPALQGPFSHWVGKQKELDPIEIENFSVSILNAVAWPLSGAEGAVSRVANEKAGLVLGRAVDAFDQFYTESFGGRKLSWRHDLSRMVLVMHLGNRKYELSVTYPQAQILFALEKTPTVAAELGKQLGLGIREIFRLLKPLLLVDLVRITDGAGGGITDDTMLSLNKNFIHSNHRLRMTPSVGHLSASSSHAADSSENDSNGSTSPSFLEEDCKFYLQALITRLLKGAKELSAARLYQLVAETTVREGRFHVASAQIRMALDHLLERQFIEHDAKHDLYIYIH